MIRGRAERGGRGIGGETGEIIMLCRVCVRYARTWVRVRRCIENSRAGGLKSGCTRATTRCATALRNARVITNCDESADLIDAGNDRVVASCVLSMRIDRGMEWKEWKKRKMPHNFSTVFTYPYSCLFISFLVSILRNCV